MRDLARRALIAAALLLGPQGAVQAASLLKLDLVADGARRPPGDRIDVSVLFFPGEDRVTLETRAFVKLEGAPEGRVVAVEAGDEEHRDPRGHWLSRLIVERPGRRRRSTPASSSPSPA